MGFRTGMWCLFVFSLAAPAAWPFNEPVTIEGPLTLRIDAPAVWTAQGEPIPVNLTVRNGGTDVILGKITLGGTDAWAVTPEGAVEFRLAPNAEQSLPFQVRPGAETYNALYPLHARAAFEAGTAKYEAHAVALTEIRFTDRPQPNLEWPWTDTPLRAGRELPLATLPIHRTILCEDQKTPRVTAVGWQGVDDLTKASMAPGQRVDRGGPLDSIAMHPPWFEGRTGSITVEYPVTLPDTQDVHLRFSAAIRDTDAARNEPPSDGVTFRVRVAAGDAPAGELGAVAYECHSLAKTWEAHEADLAAWAGQRVRIQLECDPGPRRDTTCDQAFWGAPVLAAGGGDTTAAESAEDWYDLGVIEAGRTSCGVRVRPGKYGLFDGAIAFSGTDGNATVAGVRARVFGEWIGPSSGVSQLRKITHSVAETGEDRWVHHFEGALGAFDFAVVLQITGGLLRVKFAIENGPEPLPWRHAYLEDIALGPWDQHARRVYAGVGNVVEEPEAFSLGCDGHQLASSFVGFDFASGLSMVQAVDTPPQWLEVAPETKVYTLHGEHDTVMSLIPRQSACAGVAALRSADARVAPSGFQKLAGRFVFDLWGGAYAPSARELEHAFRYGLTDAAVVWHNWQRWGYDYRLPDIYPPNPDLGTLAEFQELARVCREHDVLFAPHDNYIDLYPDADGFSYSSIAFNADRHPVRAWLNEGRGAQSYRWRADAYGPSLERNLTLIRDNIAPTAFFIDVWSSIRPYDFWTADGRFFDAVYTRDQWGKSFAWIRDLLGGAPQISESGHDQLVGWLDGAQANHLRVEKDPKAPNNGFTWRVPCQDAERIPWLDMAYHDKFALHGAGYDPRYRGGLEPALHGIFSDDYICTEVLDGHPAMVPAPFGRDVVRKYWLLHGIMRALAGRKMKSVTFHEDDIHRPYVAWEGEAEVWVNRGITDWPGATHRLPPFGFYARTSKEPDAVQAAIEWKDDLMVEWAKDPESWYVNARPWLEPGAPVQVSVEQCAWVEGGIQVAFAWNAEAPLPQAATVFVHAMDSEGRIAFQGDHVPGTPTTAWQGVVRTGTCLHPPAEAGPGSVFTLRVGLYDPATGVRIPLRGLTDGMGSVLLGTFTLTAAASVVDGITWVEAAPPETVEPRMNPERRLVDFGGVTTNGAFRLTRDGPALRLTPLPESPQFTARLAWDQLPWALPRAMRAMARDEAGQDIGPVPVTWDGDVLTLEVPQGIFEVVLAPE